MRKSAIRGLLAICAMVLMIVAGVSAVEINNSKLVKQVGGTTGDSAIVAADTATAIWLPNRTSTWWAAVACDSNSIYTTQVSYDNTYWFTVDCDTVGDGAAEATTVFENGQYAGWYVRVIQDNLTAAGAAYGISVVSWTR